MKLRNVLTVLGTAAVTAAATLALLAPRGGLAQAGPAFKPFIGQPQFTSQGCTFTLTTDKEAYEAGEVPVIEVKATNPTDKPVTASVWVSISGTAPASRMSRLLPIPTGLWSKEYAFSLEPGETKSLSATAEGKLAAGQNVTITLGDQTSAILGAVNSIPAQGGPNAQQQHVQQQIDQQQNAARAANQR